MGVTGSGEKRSKSWELGRSLFMAGGSLRQVRPVFASEEDVQQGTGLGYSHGRSGGSRPPRIRPLHGMRLDNFVATKGGDWKRIVCGVVPRDRRRSHLTDRRC